MARKPTPAASTAAADNINGDLVAADHARHGELVTERELVLAEIDRRFGLDQPYELDRYIAVARDTVAVVSQRMFVLGRICIAIKEHEGHGGFGAALDRIGIASRFARKCMAAAVKFEGTDAKKLVGATLSQAKLLELLSEDDDAIDALGEGGTLAGLNLDDIDRMSTRELREALRNERKESAQELAARDEIIVRKDEKIHKQDLKLRKAGKTPLREQGEELLGICLQRLVVLTSASDDLNTAVEELKAIFNDAGEDMPADIAAQVEHIAEVSDSHASTLRDSCEA